MKTEQAVVSESGVIVLCTAEGVVQRVLHDGIGLAPLLRVGERFAACISTVAPHRSQCGTEDAEQFMETLCGSGYAFSWETQVPVSGHMTKLSFTGGASNEGVFIVGERSQSNANHLVEELMRIHNETVNAMRTAMKVAARQTDTRDERDKELLAELSRVNNEVTRVQRELSKRNAILGRTNQELEDARAALEAKQKALETANLRLQRAMTETHHRVKNNLQLMSALIDLQCSSGAETVPMSDLARLGANVQAMGMIHDILTHESVVGKSDEVIDASSVMRRLISLVARTSGEQTLLSSLENVWLPVKHTTTLTLVANELISNALKHGQGTIEITLSSEQEKVTLEVCDNGPGFPPGFDPATATNIGLELVEKLTNSDLQGIIRFENGAKGGARVVVAFPLPILTVT